MDYENNRAHADDEPCLDDEMLSAVGDDTVVDFNAAKQSRARKAADAAQQKAEEAKRKAEEEAKADRERMEAFRAALHAFLADHDLHFVGETDCWWRFEPRDRSWLALRERPVKMLAPNVLNDRLGWAIFNGVMEENGRHHLRATCSFRDDHPPGTLNMMRPQFCEPADTADHHAVFDTLLTALSDGDTDAKDHIERLVLCKYLHPDNYLLPALAIHNEEGGAGKNLFVSALLCTVFGKELVAESLKMDDLTDRFNDHLRGKAVWFIDESVEDKADHNALKRLLGSAKLWIEPKGVGKFEIENTAWAIIVGNSGMGSVRVAGSEVDRRLSVVKVERTLNHWVRARHAAELTADTDEAAKAWVREIGQHLLRDPRQVGGWLRALMDRHGDVRHVEPFHGTAYRELVEAQKPFHELLFDAVLLDEEFRYIRKPWLYEMYAGLQRSLNNNSGVVKNRTFYKALDTWARRNSVPLASKKVKWGSADSRLSGLVADSKTTADVIYRVDRLGEEPSALARNDSDFRDDENGNGWKVSI